MTSASPFTPAHPDLANAAGVSALLANEKYVESLARITYYWGYPAVDTFGRTSTWQLMKEPGATMGLFPGAPKNRMGYLDFFMPATSPNGRHNIGTVNLDANELTFAQDGSLTLHLSHEPPTDQAAQANWLPAPDGQFALIGRAYVPTQPLLDATYTLPNVQRL